MKVSHVSIRPSEAASNAGCPALTPELLAASGARYSRNNEGLEAILEKIDPNNLERSVDSIFKMVDYGHQSIADMVPVAMFIDGISIWLAYYVWTLCPTAGGQESSTRYLKLTPEGLTDAEELGFATEEIPAWRSLMEESFAAYQAALALWENIAFEKPAVMGIPRSLLEDPSDTARKKVSRMKRNYAFDRARYFLPAAASTNIMLVMSARGWVSLCQHLLSHPLAEPRKLGEKICQTLELSAPRLKRHARRTDEHARAIGQEFEKLVRRARARSEPPASGLAILSVEQAPDVRQEEIVSDLAWHTNRYAPIGSGLQRMSVRFGWSGMGFAEIRDLNRHRTGTKYCPQIPGGFYFAADQLPENGGDESTRSALLEVSEVGRQANLSALDRLKGSDPTYVYWTLLGTEFPFEHVTTADKFIYEAELRTGVGAHFRYARHLRDALALFYQQFPGTKGLVLEGSAEPE